MHCGNEYEHVLMKGVLIIMAKNKTLVNIHTKNYVSEIFEQRLREEGFTCPDDKLLCWYRIRNGTLLDTVVFFSQYTVIPVWVRIYYEVSPFFIEPYYPRSAYQSFDILSRSDCYMDTHPKGGANVSDTLAEYSDDIRVFTAAYGNRGLYSLTDEILPYFDSIQTVEDCYRSHKERGYPSTSREFAEEVIYNGDTDIYPELLDRANYSVDLFEALTLRKPNKKEYEQALQHWQQIKTALEEGNREEFLQILNQRAQKNVEFMRKRLGLKLE